MGEHTVSSFDAELSRIDALIRGMAELAGTMVRDASAALIAGDEGQAQRVVSDDALMDERQRAIDEHAITIIAKRQPMAQDLRLVVGAIRMAADFERIGDLAKNIGKRVAAIGDAAATSGRSASIRDMADLVAGQTERVASAYLTRDAMMLEALREEDERVDTRYTAIFRELLTYMMEDPRSITACTHLLFCAKNLERIGDHVTNIAENAYFVLTGVQLPMNRPKQDETAFPASAA